MKKRIICICTVLCLLFMISGCAESKKETEQQPTQGNAEEQQFDSDTKEESEFVGIAVGDSYLEEWYENYVVTRVLWQKLRLSDEDSQKYPKLSAALEKFNDDGAAEAEAIMTEFESAAAELSGDEENPVYCEAEAEIFMQRADKNIVSFLENVYLYSGGVHPDYFVKGRNYDTETGEKVELTDVLKDMETLPSVLESKITKKYSDVAFYELEDTFSNYKPEEFMWTVDYQGITFWFSPYDIAAYAAGTLSAKIWFDEMPEIFNEKYMEAPDNYAIALPFNIDMEFDMVKGDGKTDSLYISKELDQYGSYNMLSVTVNDDTYVDEINYAYYFDTYLVHMGDRNYIYSDSKSDNDYHTLCVLDINDGEMYQHEPWYGTQVFAEYVEEGFETGTVYTEVLNNPDEFRLMFRFDLLGTRDGVAGYKINAEDGTFSMVDDSFNIESEFGLTTIIPIEAELVADGTKTEIPEGTVLYPLRSDGATYIDMKTEDGQEIRLEYDMVEYPHTVNGVPEDECFEGIMYAG